jgi:hypothetical protein
VVTLLGPLLEPVLAAEDPLDPLAVFDPVDAVDAPDPLAVLDVCTELDAAVEVLWEASAGS